VAATDEGPTSGELIVITPHIKRIIVKRPFYRANPCCLALVICSAVVGFAIAANAEETTSSQRAGKLDRAYRVQMNYLLYLPEDYESRESWPLLLFLHGSGERGDDLQLVKVHGPPKLIGEGKNFPFIVVSPQCPKNRRWQATELTALLDQIEEDHNVDNERVYVTGLSMGGFGTWSLATFAPHRFAAIAPVCGGGETYWVRDLTHLPIWVFHGDKDKAVPVERSHQMVNALKKKNGNVKLTVYPEAGHDSWTETYENPDFYTWLLEQKRPTKP
jgi:predicted peptidase